MTVVTEHPTPPVQTLENIGEGVAEGTATGHPPVQHQTGAVSVAVPAQPGQEAQPAASAEQHPQAPAAPTTVTVNVPAKE